MSFTGPHKLTIYYDVMHLNQSQTIFSMTSQVNPNSNKNLPYKPNLGVHQKVYKITVYKGPTILL